MSNIKAVLFRKYATRQTIGKLLILNGRDVVFQCKTVELPWKQNKNRISCIPEGYYRLDKRFSKRYKSHFHILNPDGSEITPRSLCLIHPANFTHQLMGCIAPGEEHVDMDGDTLLDVTRSRYTLGILLSLLPDKTPFEIYNYAPDENCAIDMPRPYFSHRLQMP